MICTSCGSISADAAELCSSCGARLHAEPAQSHDGWRDAGHTTALAVTLRVRCEHCRGKVPINGPAQRLHCPHCARDTAFARLAELLSQKSEEVGATGSRDPSPECPACGKPVSVAAYLDKAGATTTLPCRHCSATIPTYPAPAWLKAELPGALQIFGGDVQPAHADELDLRVDEGAHAPVAMACPSCGGGLTVTSDTARTLACAFCGASVFLPDDVWRRLHPVTTMLRWTLTYQGKLVTKAQIDRHEKASEQGRDASLTAQRERQARKAARRAMLGSGAQVQVDPRRFLPAQMPRWMKTGWKAAPALGIGAGVIAIMTFIVMTSISRVHGSMTSENSELGRWTLDESAWESCESGAKSGFFGVKVFAERSDWARLVVVYDGDEPVVKLGIPGTDKALRVSKAACSKLDAEVERESTSINGVRELEGHVEFDCRLDAGRVHGSVTFSNCH